MQTSGFNMFVDGGRGTRVGSDGSGLMNVWRQQLMQFKNVSVEVSNAIIARYPSPRLLYDVSIRDGPKFGRRRSSAEEFGRMFGSVRLRNM